MIRLPIVGRIKPKKAPMNTDLTITSNRTGQALGGADGATVYAKVSESADTIVRRVQATALTFPRIMSIIQAARGEGTRKGTQRTVVTVKERDVSTVVPLESGIGGRADGEATFSLSLVRPTAPGYQATFTAAKLKTLAAVAIDAWFQNVDALIAGEK
jgi:hypothetical protein